MTEKQGRIKNRDNEEGDLFSYETAGEGDRAVLSAGVVFVTFEVHVLGPVSVRHSSTAAKLNTQTHHRFEPLTNYLGYKKSFWPELFYLFLAKIDQVLEINIISVVYDGIIYHSRHLIPSLGRRRYKRELQNTNNSRNTQDTSNICMSNLF